VAGKEQTMTAIYDMEPSTSTIATAWASSDLGDPDREPKSIARHAGLVVALAGVFCAGVAFGLAVFDSGAGSSYCPDIRGQARPGRGCQPTRECAG
jgi:hypothetical protein